MNNVIYIADATLKTCNKCGEIKATDKFPFRKSVFTGKLYRNPICRTCRNANAARWTHSNPDKKRTSGKKSDRRRSKDRSENPVYHYRKKYGLTILQKAQMLAYQEGRCAICETGNPLGKKGWCVDHNHITNELRSILCVQCNALLGNAKDDPEILRKAADYLEYHMKKFSWSYSKLKNFELCPRRHHEVDLKKAWPEEESAQLAWGHAVHAAMAKALRNGHELPLVYQIYQPWIDRIRRTPGELLVEEECKWAVTKELRPTAWFSEVAWLRSIADAVKIDGEVALVVDFKTGKSINVDPIQLVLVSLIMLAHYPKIQCIRSDFIWLQEDSQTTQVLYRHEAADQWAEIISRVKRLEHATVKENFPPIPNRLCRNYCPVRSCEYHGK